MEFAQTTEEGKEQTYFQAFREAYLSLGSTRFYPEVYDLSSVSGISCDALIIGEPLKGPMVCGGSNHLIPLEEPVFDKEIGKYVTLVRMTAAATVGPRNRGDEAYYFNSRHAYHLISRVKATLPEGTELKIISATACNRLIGEHATMTWISPTVAGKPTSLQIQVGAGGGGLTAAGDKANQLRAPKVSIFNKAAKPDDEVLPSKKIAEIIPNAIIQTFPKR